MTQPAEPDEPAARKHVSGRMRAALGVAGLVGLVGIASAMVRHSERADIAPLAQAPVVETVQISAPLTAEDRWIEWKAADGPLRLEAGNYAVEVSAVQEGGLAAARLVATARDGRRIEWTGDGSAWEASGDFALIRMEPDDPMPSLMAASFSGGAHCCTSLTMLSLEPQGWRRYDLGQRDGDSPSLPTDLGGDGRKEFRSVDQSFLYAFDSYAGSWAPPVVERLESGRLRDVSSERAFRPLFLRAAEEARDACRQRSNGACVAYLASAARTGSLDEAWPIMLDGYDQASTWELPTACRVRTASDCPADAQMTFATYPEAVQWFLGDQGYTAPVYLEPLRAAGPSFDCGAVTSPGELSVCGDADLAVLDRTLAVAFTRAMALTRDRSALRGSQRQFLQQRNGSSNAVEMTALYEARINQLLALDER